jgi:hypothetical protein
VGLAVKITDVPAQILDPVLAEILQRVIFGFTVTVEVSVYAKLHPTALIL